jgi:hypothetical protein
MRGGSVFCRATVVVALLVGLLASAQAQTRRSTPQPIEQLEIERSPLIFYLARGELNACGPGCSEWIAAEGQFDSGAAERLRNFLKRIPGRNLPVYFYSPGGLTDNALAIGRLLRERGMTAGVARTTPDSCRGKSAAACRALKQSGQVLTARWRSINAGCNSSCVYALIGAKIRDVPPGARVGVHSSKVPYVGEHLKPIANARLASFNIELRHYLREMGIHDDLYGTIQKVPFEKVYILSREELARFRIDTRSFQETPWTLLEASPPGRTSIIKLFTHANGPEAGTGLLRLSCGGPNQISVRYVRELMPDGTARPAAGVTTWAAIGLVAGPTGLTFPRDSTISDVELVDTGRVTDARARSASIAFFDAAMRQTTLDLVETDLAANVARRVLKLSTLGLSEALAALRRTCD